MLRPINKRLLVRPIVEEKTNNGIILINDDKALKIYEIIRVEENKHGLKEGDKIILDKYGPKEVETGEENLYIIQIEQVMAIIEEK